MSSIPPLTHSVRVAGICVTWTFDRGRVDTEWDPVMPEKLDAKGMREYIAGRRDFLTKVAAALSHSVVVIDLGTGSVDSVAPPKAGQA